MNENEKISSETIVNKKKYTMVSMDENIEREPEFYYSREHRLDRASAAVRDLNNDKPVKASVAKNLFGSRGNVMIFIMIIITCLMLSFFSRYLQTSADVKLGGNTVKMSILKEEGVLILDVIKQSPASGIVYAGEVEIAVSPVMPKLNEGETPPVFFHRVVFNPAGYESFQILLPFDFDVVKNDFLVLLGTPEEQKALKLSAR
jgi:uncharacterized membrane protein YwzB